MNLQVSKITDTTAVVASANYAFTADSHKVRSVLAVYTSATASFTLTLQYSNDNVNFTDFTTATAITNASGLIDWQVLDTKDALYFRVKSTRASGTLDTLKIFVANIERS